MRLWLGVIVGLVLVSTAVAAPPTGKSFVFDYALSSCATWLSTPLEENGGDHWILGAWSGMNLFNPDNHAVGNSTDALGIVGVIKQECQANPAMNVADAVLVVYTNFAAGGK